MAQSIDNEDIKWLYGKLKSKGYNIGSEEDFASSLSNEADREWYYEKSKAMGLDFKSLDDFNNLYAPKTTAGKSEKSGIFNTITDFGRRVMENALSPSGSSHISAFSSTQKESGEAEASLSPDGSGAETATTGEADASLSPVGSGTETATAGEETSNSASASTQEKSREAEDVNPADGVAEMNPGDRLAEMNQLKEATDFYERLAQEARARKEKLAQERKDYVAFMQEQERRNAEGRKNADQEREQGIAWEDPAYRVELDAVETKEENEVSPQAKLYGAAKGGQIGFGDYQMSREDALAASDPAYEGKSVMAYNRDKQGVSKDGSGYYDSMPYPAKARVMRDPEDIYMLPGGTKVDRRGTSADPMGLPEVSVRGISKEALARRYDEYLRLNPEIAKEAGLSPGGSGAGTAKPTDSSSNSASASTQEKRGDNERDSSSTSSEKEREIMKALRAQMMDEERRVDEAFEKWKTENRHKSGRMSEEELAMKREEIRADHEFERRMGNMDKERDYIFRRYNERKGEIQEALKKDFAKENLKPAGNQWLYALDAALKGDRELEALSVQSYNLGKAAERYEEWQADGRQGSVANYVGGTLGAVGDAVMNPFGLTDLQANTIPMMRIKEKAQKGEELTADEALAMESHFFNKETEGRTPMSLARTAGEFTGALAEMAAEFGLNPASGLARRTLSRIVAEVGKDGAMSLIRKSSKLARMVGYKGVDVGGLRVAGNIAKVTAAALGEGAVMAATTQGVKNVNQVFERTMTEPVYDSEGNLAGVRGESGVEATAKTGVSSALTNAAFVFPATFGVKVMRGFDNMAKTLHVPFGNPVDAFVKMKSGEAMGIMTADAVGRSELDPTWRDFADPGKNGELIMGLLAAEMTSGSLRGGFGMANGARLRHGREMAKAEMMAKAVRGAEHYKGSEDDPGRLADWEAVVRSIYEGDENTIVEALTRIARDPSLSAEQKAAALDYARSAYRYIGAERAYENWRTRGAREAAAREAEEDWNVVDKEKPASEEDFSPAGSRAETATRGTEDSNSATASTQKKREEPGKEEASEEPVSREMAEMMEDEAYSDGYGAASSDAPEDLLRGDELVKRMDDVYSRIEDAFGDEADFYRATIEEDPWSVIEDPSLDDSQRDAVLEFVNAKSALTGFNDGVADASERRREDISRDVERYTHRQNGMIQPAVMEADGRIVYVVSGNVVMNEDGKGVDRTNSDSQVFVYDPQKGGFESTAPEFIREVGESVNPADEVEARFADAEQARQVAIEEAKASAQDTASTSDGGLSPDGSVARTATTGEGALNSASASTQEKREEDGRSAFERIPVDEKTKEPRFEEADPELTWNALVETSSEKFADNRISNAEKELKKIDKLPNNELEFFKYKKRQEEIDRARAEAQRRLDYWRKVKAVGENRVAEAARIAEEREAEARRIAEEQAEAEKRAELQWREQKAKMPKIIRETAEKVKDCPEAVEILSDTDPHDILEAASWVLSMNKLLVKDNGVLKGFREMTGYKTGEVRKFFGLFASAENGGKTLERLAEDAMQEICETNGIPYENSEALNALLDVLQMCGTVGEIRNYIENNRISQAMEYYERWKRNQEWTPEEEAEYEDYLFKQEHGITRQEYEAWSEYINETLEDRDKNFDENEFYGNIADDLASRRQNEISYGNRQGEITEGDPGGSSGGDGVLQNAGSEGAGSISGDRGEVLHSSPDVYSEGEGADGGRSGVRETDGDEGVVRPSVLPSYPQGRGGIEPTEAQKAAGNYKMEHRRIDGYNISIENPRGSVRSGKNADGTPWETEMHNDYGYIRGTEGVDGDHIDVFLSDTPEEGGVFVVDQYNPDGSFDEHKVMYGFPTKEAARDAYLSNYEDGWETTRRIDVTGVTKDEFKKWVNSSRRKTKPFAEYKSVKAIEGNGMIGRSLTEPEAAEMIDRMEAITPIGSGKFGKIFVAFRGKVKEAWRYLSELKSGQARGVFYRPEIGEIDLVWGDAPTPYSGKGLAHIDRKHVKTLGDFSSMEEAIEIIDEVVRTGVIKDDKSNTVAIEKGNYKVVIARDESGNWILTAFDATVSAKEKKKRKDAATSGTPGQPNEGAGAVAPNLSESKDNTLLSDKQADERKGFETEHGLTISDAFEKYLDFKSDGISFEDKASHLDACYEILKPLRERVPQMDEQELSAVERDLDAFIDREISNDNGNEWIVNDYADWISDTIGLGKRRKELDEQHALESAVSLAEEVMASVPRKSKVKIEKFVHPRSDITIGGVYHDAERQMAIASDSRVLVMSKSDYRAENAGKVVTSEGVSDRKYPDVARVIPSEEHIQSRDAVDFGMLEAKAEAALAKGKAEAFTDKEPQVVVESKNGNFAIVDAAVLRNFARGARHVGASEVGIYRNGETSWLVARGENGLSLMIGKGFDAGKTLHKISLGENKGGYGEAPGIVEMAHEVSASYGAARESEDSWLRGESGARQMNLFDFDFSDEAGLSPGGSGAETATTEASPLNSAAASTQEKRGIMAPKRVKSNLFDFDFSEENNLSPDGSGAETAITDNSKTNVNDEKHLDNQGNPIDNIGKLSIEDVRSVNDITDNDFLNPTRNIGLPPIPQNVDKAIGANGRKVIIKKNIFDKNRDNHEELTPSDSRDILNRALYNPNLTGTTQPIRRPDYKVAIQTGDKNAVVVLDVYAGKDNVEIVGWRKVDEKGLEKMKRQAEREGGQFLILSPMEGSAAALSALPSDISSDGKGNTLLSDKQVIEGKGSGHGVEWREAPRRNMTIEDFGEKIAGARKDLLRDLSRNLGNVNVESLVKLTLSKAVKRPDFGKMVERGAMTEDEALTAEAMWQEVYSTRKPAATSRRRRAIVEWAVETERKIRRLEEFINADSERRREIMERNSTASFPDEEKEAVDFRRIQELNPTRQYDLPLYTPSAAWVNRQVMDAMGFHPGDGTKIEFSIIPNMTYQYYAIVDASGRMAPGFPSTRDLNNAVEMVTLATRMQNGDLEVEYPSRFFSAKGNDMIEEETGEYEVAWIKGYNIKSEIYPDMESAEKKLESLKAKGEVAEIYPVKRGNGYKSYSVRFRNPLNGEEVILDGTYPDRATALQMIEDDPQGLSLKVNGIFAERLKDKKGSKSHFYVTSVYENGGFHYAVCRNDVGGKLSPLQNPVVKSFESRKEAEEWFKKNGAALESRYADMMKRKRSFVYFEQTDRSRRGEDYRNGKDVTPQQFSETFGFRGVQFGNWTNDADRQAALNEAYDALRDLASVLGLDSRDLSLNGELGLAFGSRGSGSANAHYESGEVVINLTKTRGAGSLAHEWWHALDNYLMRKAGVANGFATEHLGGRSNMRSEVAGAITDLVKAVGKSNYAKRSASQGKYWGSVIEETARLFGEWVVMKQEAEGSRNYFLSRGIEPGVVDTYRRMTYYDYKETCKLADVVPMSFEEWKGRNESLGSFPYPTEEELKELSGPMDRVFEALRNEGSAGMSVAEIAMEPAAGYSKDIFSGKQKMQARQLSLFDDDFTEKPALENECRMVDEAVDEYCEAFSELFKYEENEVPEEILDQIYDLRDNLHNNLVDYFRSEGNTEKDAADRAREMLINLQAQVSVAEMKRHGKEFDLSATESDSASAPASSLISATASTQEKREAKGEISSSGEKNEKRKADFGVEVRKENAGGDLMTYQHEGWLPELGEGEFSLLEREFSESGEFNFSGGRIESADDVAYMMRSLEFKSIENTFGVLVKDGKATIVHVGMGTADRSLVNFQAIKAADLVLGGAEKIWLVHNHPSGTLRSSIPDENLHNVMKRMFGERLQPSIIMDTLRGEYAEFGSGVHYTNKRPGVPQGKEVDARVYRFDDTAYSEDFDFSNLKTIKSSADVAQLLGAYRLGKGDKAGVLILDQANHVVGNLPVPHNFRTEEGVETIVNYAVRGGGVKVIVYGNKPMMHSELKAFGNKILEKSGNSIQLLDLMTSGASGYESAQDNGLMEPEAEYGNDRMRSSAITDNSAYGEGQKEGGEYGATPEGDIRFREVEDDAVLKEFAEGNTIKAYRTMQVIDGKLYSPMATKVGGKATPEIKLGVPEQAEEHPEIIKRTKVGKDGVEVGYVVIDKGLGKGTLEVAYNPSIHASLTPLNDQFTSADIRPNLVIVETLIPKSELTSSYRAPMAKDAVGEMSWHSGTVSGKLAKLGKPRRVILSRYDMPVRIVPFKEVAQMIASQLDGTGIEMPYNVVMPQVRMELERLGVTISEEASGRVGEEADYGKAEYITDQEIERINAHQKEMVQTSPEAKRSHAEKLAMKFNIPIQIVTDINELTSKNAEVQKRLRESKGFYSPATGKVVIVVPNHVNVEDVAQTVFHEVVAHKGLREMFGDEYYDAFCDEIYEHLKDDLKEEVDRDAYRRFIKDPGKGYEYHRRAAVDELFGRLAEKGFEDFTKAERSLWTKLRVKVLEAINKFLGALKLPKWVKLGDNELRYILWRSHERLRTKGDYVDMARDAAKRDDLGLNKNDIVIKRSRKTSADRIEESFNAAVAGDLKGKPVEIGHLTKEGKSYLERLSGLKLKDNVKFKLNPSDLVHIYKRHFGSNEKDTGQNIPLTIEDIRRIADILSHPDKVLFGTEKEGDNRKMFFFLKSDEASGAYNLLEIYANAWGNLTSKSFYRTKKSVSQRAMLLNESPTLTSVTDGPTLYSDANLPKFFDTSTIEDEEMFDLRFRDGGRDSGMGLEETITNMKVEAMRANADNLQARNDAMRAIGGNLSKLRQAMSRQRIYDETTVRSVSDLARVMLENGLLDDLSKYETKRILSAVNNVVGRRDVEPYVQKVVDIMVDNQLRMSANAFGKLLSIKGSKVDARGIEVQGALDPDGQTIAKVVRKTFNLSRDEIEDRMSDAIDRMGSQDKAVADEAALEYSGLRFANLYAENIKGSKVEERSLRDSIEEAREEHKNGTGGWTDASLKQFVQATEDAIRQNKVERVESYQDLVELLGDELGQSIERAKAWREAEKRRVEDIHHNANSDMEGRPTDEHHRDDRIQKLTNNSWARFVLAPLGTFDQMLRMFGNKNSRGEGYLWNCFMRGWVDATEKEYTGYQNALKVLDDKVSEVFDKKMKWGDLFAMDRKLPKASVRFMDGGEMKDHELTQGNLLYIYMVDKMSDGRMKLRKMGITEDDIENIKNFLDPKFIELADWMQNEFLVDKRNEYNEAHKRMFGASMAAIENYFPLKVLSNARTEEIDIADDSTDTALPATSTGSIIKRKRNSLALDVTGANAFSVILDHLQQMEKWNAFAEFNRDLNTLLSYKHFRNQVMNMSSVYGGGKTLWKNFRNVCSMAAGAYRPPIAALDKAAVNIAKGVTAAKVSFRVFTALKQFLSFPAYFSDANPIFLAKNVANPVGAWNWSMKNLPLFHKRWHSRMAGDPRLMKTDLDWKGWRNKVVELASRVGMSPNAFVDALTVSIGARSMYETRLAKYKRYGYDDATADRKAKQDATILFNQTQQSSEDAFLSTLQVDRSWLSVLFTVFRNSSMSYSRQLYDAIRNIKRRLGPGYSGLSEEFMAKQMIRDGIDPDKADRNAKQEYRRGIIRDFVRVGIFGYILQFAWNLGAYLPYLILGDDDETKDEFWDDVFNHTFFGSIEGLTGGDVMSAAGQMALNGDGNWGYLVKDMPLASDISSILKKWPKDKMAAMNDVINLCVQSGLGMNPQSLTDAVVAVIDYCGDDAQTSRECALLIARILNCPPSQLDKVHFDELGADGIEASKMTPAEIAERYARYKMMREAPLTGWMRNEADRDSVAEQKQKRVKKIAKERISERVATDETKRLIAESEEFDKRNREINELRDEGDMEAFRRERIKLMEATDMRKHLRVKRYKRDIKELTEKFLKVRTTEERDSVVEAMLKAREQMLLDLAQ